MVDEATLPRMGEKKPQGGKKRPTSGKNKTPRTPIQMPTEWHVVAKSRAKAAKQPVLWYLITLIEKDAIEAGMTKLPAPPWDKKEEDGETEQPDRDATDA